MKIQIIEKNGVIENVLIGDGVLVGAAEYEVAEIPEDFHENSADYAVKETEEVMIPVVVFDGNKEKIMPTFAKGAELIKRGI